MLGCAGGASLMLACLPACASAASACLPAALALALALAIGADADVEFRLPAVIHCVLKPQGPDGGLYPHSSAQRVAAACRQAMARGGGEEAQASVVGAASPWITSASKTTQAPHTTP